LLVLFIFYKNWSHSEQVIHLNCKVWQIVTLCHTIGDIVCVFVCLLSDIILQSWAKSISKLNKIDLQLNQFCWSSVTRSYSVAVFQDTQKNQGKKISAMKWPFYDETISSGENSCWPLQKCFYYIFLRWTWTLKRCFCFCGHLKTLFSPKCIYSEESNLPFAY